MHIRTALGHKHTCRLTDDHGISCAERSNTGSGRLPWLGFRTCNSGWWHHTLSSSCASGLQSAPSHILCIACHQWQVGTASSGRPGTASGSRPGLGPGDHQQTGGLLFFIIFFIIYYTHYDTIIVNYDTIIVIIFLQMSGLLFPL